MSVYLINYTLHSPGQNHRVIREYINSFSSCKLDNTVWLIDTRKELSQLLKEINGLIDKNDDVSILTINATNNLISTKPDCKKWFNRPK